MMRTHTHGWMTQQSNQGAVSGASDQGDTTRRRRTGEGGYTLNSKEGYSRKIHRIRRSTGEKRKTKEMGYSGRQEDSGEGIHHDQQGEIQEKDTQNKIIRDE